MRERNYILGVDGGNSKTDYILCDENGEFVDIIRCPTCSHEHVGVGYDGMEKLMSGQLDKLFDRHRISVANIKAAAFGLAGADLPDQIEELNTRVRNLGFTKYELFNDGILGIKAVAKSGVCAINGSGTVIVGINDAGKVLQVGGIGSTGDRAGGYHIARTAITEVYEILFRRGGASSMTPGVLELLGVKDIYDLPAKIAGFKLTPDATKEIVQVVDECAVGGDEAAAKILDDVGINCGEGVNGCVRHLTFDGEINIIKAGSIWNKLKYQGMTKAFEKVVRADSPKAVFTLLDAPPALGAIFWAMEISSGEVTDSYRSKMLEFLNIKRYEELIRQRDNPAIAI